MRSYNLPFSGFGKSLKLLGNWLRSPFPVGRASHSPSLRLPGWYPFTAEQGCGPPSSPLGAAGSESAPDGHAVEPFPRGREDLPRVAGAKA
jgi:hypothetical protein